MWSLNLSRAAIAVAEVKTKPVESVAPAAPPVKLSLQEMGISLDPPKVEYPVMPPSPNHFPLDLSAAFNATVGQNWKRENNDENGIPADGRIQVPGVLPRAYFKFAMPTGPNAIQAGAGPTVAIAPSQRGNYGRLAILHGSPKDDSVIHATLHYATGDDKVEKMLVRDWNRDGPAQVNLHKALQAGKIQLYAEVLPIDNSRVLESVSFDGEGCIFGITAIVSGPRPFTSNEDLLK